jgi:hypothetical protein
MMALEDIQKSDRVNKKVYLKLTKFKKGEKNVKK